MENLLTILRGCKEKDHKYQKIFYERYRGNALKIVFRYIYNYEEAVEVTNDGFVKIFLNIDKFRCIAEVDADKLLNAWLKKIMINTAIDLLRKKMLLPEIGGLLDSHLEIKQETNSSDKFIVYKDLINLVKKLPPVYRIVFNMHIIDGYSHMEIAETLRIPIATSKSNLLRARSLMVKYLNQAESLIKCSI